MNKFFNAVDDDPVKIDSCSNLSLAIIRSDTL